MMWARFQILRAIRSLGFELRRVASPEKLEIEWLGADPVTLEYCRTKRGYAMMEIPLSDSRGFHAMGLRLTSQIHPFVQAFKNAMLEQGAERERTAIENVLKRYYALVHPMSAGEVVGLPSAEAPGLHDVPPIGYIMPWGEKGIRETDRKSTRLNSSHLARSRMPSSA